MRASYKIQLCCERLGGKRTVLDHVSSFSYTLGFILTLVFRLLTCQSNQSSFTQLLSLQTNKCLHVKLHLSKLVRLKSAEAQKAKVSYLIILVLSRMT